MRHVFLVGVVIFVSTPPLPSWNVIGFYVLWWGVFSRHHCPRWYYSSVVKFYCPRDCTDLNRFQYNKPVLFYKVAGRENKKNRPQIISIVHLCFCRSSETTSTAMKKLVEIEIQATQVRNYLALKSFRNILSNKSYIKCSHSGITLVLNSFEADKKCPPLLKILATNPVHHLTSRECNKWGTCSHRLVANGQDPELHNWIQSRCVVAKHC